MADEFETSDEATAYADSYVKWQSDAPEMPDYEQGEEQAFIGGWFAARSYFSEDSEGSKEQPPADLDNRRIALQHAMNEAARPSTDPKKVVERANEFLTFLNGEDK
jgi:hypothetical protein